jgi:hypothetical protein
MRKAPGETDFRLIDNLTPNYVTYIDNTPKQPGGVYQYSVKAIGFILYNENLPVSVTIPAAPPAAPVNVGFTPANAHGLKLFWDDKSNNETSFVISKTYNGTVMDPVSVAPDQEKLLLNDLADGTYVFTVKAVNAAGSSAVSNPVIVVIPMSIPEAPSNLAATALSNGSVSLTWSDNSNNEAQFIIERKTDAGSFMGIAETAANVTNYTDSNTSPGTVYTYRVAAVNNYGTSDYSGAASVTTPAGTGTGGIDYSTASSWAKPEIEAAYQYGLVTDKLKQGYQQNITREEFCEIAVRLYEKLSHTQAVYDGNNPFTDTTNSEIIKAYKLGITNGISAAEFGPYNPITRQEICVMVVRTLRAAIPNLDTTVNNPNIFADNSAIDTWAIKEVRFANQKGIMNGVGGNMFDPLNNTKREQAVVIIKRCYEAFK